MPGPTYPDQGDLGLGGEGLGAPAHREKARIKWLFTLERAREKLGRAYPALVSASANRAAASSQSHPLCPGTRAFKPVVDCRSMAAPIVDVGVLTVREDEFLALLSVFPNEEGIYRGQREYSLRIADAGAGARYRVALLRTIEQGNGESQDAARDFIEDLHPALLLVVGIAGALPSQDVTLGDVVLSTRVNEYCVSARKEGTEPTYNLGGGPIEKQIAAGISNLHARGRDLGEWTRDLPQRPAVVWDRRGMLYGPNPWRRDLKRSLEHHFGATRDRPSLFTAGVIASSDILVKDPKVVFPWIQTARHLLAVEMESGGVFRAARGRCPMLAIRGISDVIGLKRDDGWTKFACAAGAVFARAYLRTQPVSPAALRTPSPSTSDARRATAPQVAPTGGTASTLPESLYANLLPLKDYPSTVYVAPATCRSQNEGWAKLLEGSPRGIRNLSTNLRQPKVHFTVRRDPSRPPARAC